MGTWGASEEPTRPWARPRVILAVVALVAAAHTMLYAFAVPPWALEDEEQHVDYVLALRDNRKPPHLDDLLSQDIVDSAVTTDRWGSFGLGRPAAAEEGRMDPAHMGLEGYSYEGYQPPLYYAALVPAAAALGDRLLAFLYTGRLLGALLVAVGAVLAAMLSARWAPTGKESLAAWIGGLSCALLPANAEAAARINNDFACAVLVTGGVVCLTRLVDRPDRWWSLWAGLVFAAAVLTKPGGVVGVGASFAVLGLLAMRRELSLRISASLLVPQALAVGVWSLVSHARYGVWNPSTAVVDRRLRFPALSWDTIASQALDRGATPYGVWHLGTALTVGWLAFVVVGLVLLRRSALRAEAFLLVVGIGSVAVMGLVSLNNSGLLNAFTARYLIFAFPTLLAAAAAGWAHLRRPVVSLAPVALAAVAATAFLLADFLPQFPLRVG